MRKCESSKPKILAFRKKLYVTVLVLSFSISPFVITGVAGTDSMDKSIIEYQSHAGFILQKQGMINILKPLQYLSAHTPKVIEAIRPTDLIMGQGLVDMHVLSSFLISHNPRVKKADAMELAKIYVEEANVEGVNYEIAFSQMCLETGFLKFGGDVDPSQNNFCGLGVTGGGVKGHSFIDKQTGVRAHIQHLKAYASTQKLKTSLVDQRFHFVKRGCVERVDELTGKWATDKRYGNKINYLLKRLYDHRQQVTSPNS